MLIDGNKLKAWLEKYSEEIQNTPVGDDEYYEGLLDGRNDLAIDLLEMLEEWQEENFKVEK